jgi:prolyl-tRNA synthetase
MSSLSHTMKSLSLGSSVTHAPTANAASWREALAGVDVPDTYSLTKTLVFKPKAAKDQASVLIVVVALDETATNAKQIASVVNAKEARLATAEVVKETLGVTVEQGRRGKESAADDSFSAGDFEG